MPAAAWAAKSGDPILFVRKDEVPPDTRAAIAVPPAAQDLRARPVARSIAPKVTRILRRLGPVTRIGGADPVTNAIAFARFVDGPFGWGVVDPGHGLVFANARRPLDAGARRAAVGHRQVRPAAAARRADDDPAERSRSYLLDIQPGYTRDPVRGVYNHGWIIGDGEAISEARASPRSTRCWRSCPSPSDAAAPAPGSLSPR